MAHHPRVYDRLVLLEGDISGSTFRWTIDIDAGYLHGVFSTPTTGHWFAVGFNEASSMVGADAIVVYGESKEQLLNGTLHSEGVYLLTAKSIGCPGLCIDSGGRSFYSQIYSSHLDGTSAVHFSRPLAIADPGSSYTSIAPNSSLFVVWALGQENGLGYHGSSSRGAVQVDLFADGGEAFEAIDNIYPTISKNGTVNVSSDECVRYYIAANSSDVVTLDFSKPFRLSELQKRSVESCAMQAMPSITRIKGPDFALCKAHQLQTARAIFDCHEIGHVVGQTFAEAHPTWQGAYQACPPTCVWSCHHGVLQAAMSALPQDEIEAQILNMCPPSMDTYYTCVHGVGHAIMLSTFYSFRQALALCFTGSPSFAWICSGGVIMQYISGFTSLPTSQLKKHLQHICDLNVISGSAQLMDMCFEILGEGLVFHTDNAAAAAALCNLLSSPALPSGAKRQCLLGVGGETRIRQESGLKLSATCSHRLAPTPSSSSSFSTKAAAAAARPLVDVESALLLLPQSFSGNAAYAVPGNRCQQLEDTSSKCASDQFWLYCSDPLYSEWMHTNCRKLCCLHEGGTGQGGDHPDPANCPAKSDRTGSVCLRTGFDRFCTSYAYW
eukprot:CAMPEP_0175120462 /NCGR_PEP_ID=MMETSP0087-20121206/634_1 /TAXON_ID=136419 /ORGANISM="Unknown Unknown, Strain D1" /LENGTH=608 /DNA_ID=CAMNT_0016401911 /DNA_START=81 /DNA_END=1904 /DNA_ORIENTATION=-